MEKLGIVKLTIEGDNGKATYKLEPSVSLTVFNCSKVRFITAWADELRIQMVGDLPAVVWLDDTHGLWFRVMDYIGGAQLVKEVEE